MGYKVKRIMVGDKQVRPSVYEFYFNFRNSSTALAQNAGFIFDYITTLEYGSNGVRVLKLSGAAKNSNFTKTVDFSKANKVDIISNVYLSTGTWNGGVYQGISSDNSWSGLNYAAGGIYASTYYSKILNARGSYQGDGSESYYSGTPSNGAQEFRTLFDFNDKKLTMYRTLNGATIQKQISLSDTQITTLRGASYFYIHLDGGDGGAYLSDTKITVE